MKNGRHYKDINAMTRTGEAPALAQVQPRQPLELVTGNDNTSASSRPEDEG